MHPDDLGKVIGRGGRTATALRTWSPASAAAASASTSWTPTSSSADRSSAGMAAPDGPRGRTRRQGARHRAARSSWTSAPTIRTAVRRRVGPARRARDKTEAPDVVDAAREHGGRLLVRLRRHRDRDARRRPAGQPVHRRHRGPAGHDGPRRVLRPPARSVCGVRTTRAATLGAVAEVLAYRRAGPAVVQPTRRPRCWSRSSARSCPRSTLAAGRIVEIDPPDGLSIRMRSRCTIMRIDVVTIFPDYLAPLRPSLTGKADAQRASSTCDVHDLRRWTHDVHRTVDDTPYGGGPGMVMRPEPWGEALDELGIGWTRCSSCRRLRADRSPRPTPRGWRAEPHLVFACGRYEGIDQRVLDDAATPHAGRGGLDRRLRAARRRGRPPSS